MVEPDVPKVPMDYTWAKRLGLVRKPANFISSISDDRGDELRSVLRPARDTNIKKKKHTCKQTSMLVSAGISDGFPGNHSALLVDLAELFRSPHACPTDDIPHDSRGSYAGMPISEVFSADIGLGGVLSLLWFRRRLPDYATKFIEMILMVRRRTAMPDFVEPSWANSVAG